MRTSIQLSKAQPTAGAAGFEQRPLVHDPRAGEPECTAVTHDFGRIGVFGSAARRGPDRTGMPTAVRAKMERAFGSDFSDVRIHAESTRAVDLGAMAFTQGREIHIAPGQWAPATSAGQNLLGHELAHVLQQRAGRVGHAPHPPGIPVHDDQGLEREADELARRAFASGGG
ncbi:MAG: DUF4157 domain-containing protein, partial [Planctomycetes bacterium]|nr:DUF4157 domain-containing protein [Planctomycetota bacterium]